MSDPQAARQAADVIAGRVRWAAECSDCLAWLRGLPDDSVDLLFTSPPYELARTYGIGEKMVGGQAWVDWMVEVVAIAAPKVKGLIAVNCEGQTRGYRYSCVPFLLMADLHRAGFNLRKPPVFHRVGIPGSGGPDWLRNDYEPIVCVTRPGKLPWSDNTACGHPPKWAPGGDCSYRNAEGKRKNAVPKFGYENGDLKKRSAVYRNGKPTQEARNRVGAHRSRRQAGYEYVPPDMSNPGNVIEIAVGGGRMGHDLAHENEAPFPLELPAFFVKSFCPPDGIVADCFAGSGTTIDAAVQHGRRGIGCDVRESQVRLIERRMATVTPCLDGFA
jgi:site-specific DNA-methyltransferase (adenine-specific)